jgi:glucose/arabinose dehydrogenase
LTAAGPVREYRTPQRWGVLKFPPVPRRRLLLPLALLAMLAACGAGGADEPDAPSTPAAAPAPPPTTPAPRPRARRAQVGLRLTRIAGFEAPLYVTQPPGDSRRLFVVEQGGAIRVVRDGRELPAPFLDISDRVQSGGEQGLLGMAFAPDYARSGRFYVYYTDNGANQRVEEFRRSGPDRASRASRRLVLHMGDPESNHNGGPLQFGPDGLMYIGTGDGGGGDDQHGRFGNGQNLNSLLGKLLRIDPRASRGRRYRIPRDNPFVGRRGRDEIYAYGLRNPWRFSFDRSTGDIVIADVGQNAIEEVNFERRDQARGRNFGWRVWEGRRRNYSGERAPGALFPELAYSLGGGNCAVTGGYVVRDPRLAGWQGRYLYGDYCRGVVRSVRLSPGRASGDSSTGLRAGLLSSFGQDGAGRIYVTSQDDGAVYRIDPR